MTATPDTLARLDALIQQGIELLQRLQELLNAELEALQNRALEPLQQNNRAKQECLLAVDRNIRERNALLDSLGIKHDRMSVLDFIAGLTPEDSQRLHSCWQQLESALDEVKTLNQRNEQILLRSKQSTDQLLALLQGHAQGNSIYDQKGDKGRYEGQRSLGKA
jgi:flagellar biosynthesis/type III secretory pathway chaperone